jgi:HK97 family phage prohead protease
MEIATGFLFMPIERKFTSLKDLKVSDDGSGSIEGYRSVYGVIDEGGDIVVKGAFKDTLSDYLLSGFTAQSHDWDFDKAVGFPVDAHEDDHGWFVKSQFHSTPDAQNVRTKAKERLAAGKTVGFSFGYAPTSFAHVEAKDYEAELPKYIKADLLPAMLEKAQKFNRIRILKSVEAIEDSIVTAPMNKRATATAAKSAEQVESTLESELDALITAHGKDKIIDYLKGQPVSDSFESFDDVVSALAKHTSNMQRNHENRVKEGRILSDSNRKKVLAARDALDELLAASEPKPKEKSIDVAALRTQSLRMQSLAIRALA